MATSSPNHVLIVGCGIAGPVLAIMLKEKGYDPIVFEKVSRIGDAGASLMAMPNGLKVLSLIGMSETVVAQSRPLEALEDFTAQGKSLGTSDVPGTFKDKFMQPQAGVKRTYLNLTLKDKLQELGVEVREGWKFLLFEEDDTSITAFFDKDRSVKGSFIIGCDGIKSATRESVLASHGVKEKPPVYTGLMQTAAISTAPPGLREVSALRNWYGDGLHAIGYPVSATQISWGITQQKEEETGATWRAYEGEEAVQQKKLLAELLSGWDPNIRQLVDNADRIVRYGLFDHEELLPEHWYSKRCVLVGDAAHATSPHLGQGANQALEDCYHLSQSLPALKPGDQTYDEAVAALGPGLSTTVFKAFANKRQPRTSALVKGARAVGQHRVVFGEEACRKRDAAVVMSFQDITPRVQQYTAILREPFNEV